MRVSKATNLFLERQFRSVEDGLNPVVLESRLSDVVQRPLDRRLDKVGVLHRNALKADAENRVP
jgi:hypothetical protein